MATIPFFLLVLFFCFNKYWALNRESRIISKVPCVDCFSVVKTEQFISMSRVKREYQESSGESSDTSNRDEDSSLVSLDYETFHSEHEQPKEISTHTNYSVPGQWAKPPINKDGSPEFVPTKLYAQVRASHVIKHVPNEEVLETAETQEDKENAARLREVITNKRIATVYTEEGYEDSAYDHGGHIKDADYHEDFGKNFHGKLNQKKYVSPAKKNVHSQYINEDDYSDKDSQYPEESKIMLESANIKRKKSRKNKNKSKSDKNLNQNFNQTFNKWRFYPKVVVEDGINQLEKSNKLNEEEAEKRSAINREEKLLKLKSTPEDDRKHLTEKSNALQVSHGFNYNINSKNETKKDLEKGQKIDPSFRKRKQLKNNLSSKNRIKENNFILKINPNMSNEIDILKKTAYFEPALARSSNEHYNVTRLGYDLSTDIPKSVNSGNILYEVFKERQNQRAVLHPNEFKKTTIQTDPFISETVKRHVSYLTPLNENSVIILNSSLDYTTTESTNDLITSQIIVSSSPQISFPLILKSNNNESLSQTDNRTFLPEIIGHNNTGESMSVYTNATLLHQKKTLFDHNPFLIHNARSSETNIPRYKVLVRNQKNLKESEASAKKKFNNPSNKKLVPFHLNTYYKKMVTDLQNQKKIWPVINDFGNSEKIQKFVSSELSSPPTYTRLKNNDFLPYYRTIKNHAKFNNNRKLKENTHMVPFDVQGNSVTLNNNRFSKYHFQGDKQLSLNPNFISCQKELYNMLYLRPPVQLDKTVYIKYLRRKKRSKYVDEHNVNKSFNNFSSEMTVNKIKYPFYKNDVIPSLMTLKYMVNPEQVPKKTFGGMEFYDSRSYLDCDEEDPNLENVVPEKEEPAKNQSLKTGLPRLNGLGEKLDCFKAKYFDNNPLDNPLFLESQVEQPILPKELNTRKYKSKVLIIPSNEKDSTILRNKKSGLRLPQNKGFIDHLENSSVQKVNTLQINPTSMNRPIKNKENYKTQGLSNSGRESSQSELFSIPYQSEVYQDVIGTIYNFEHLYDKVNQKTPFKIFKNNNNLHITDRTVSPFSLMNSKKNTKKLINYPANSFAPSFSNNIFRSVPYRSHLRKRSVRSTFFRPNSSGSSSEIFFSKNSTIFNNANNKSVPPRTSFIRMKRRSNFLKLNLLVDNPINNTNKTIYTIYDRIRHSKPKNIYDNSVVNNGTQKPSFYSVVKRKDLSAFPSVSTEVFNNKLINLTKVLHSSFPHTKMNIDKNEANKLKQKINMSKELTLLTEGISFGKKNKPRNYEEVDAANMKQYNVHQDVKEAESHVKSLEYVGSNPQDNKSHSLEDYRRKQHEDDNKEDESYVNDESSDNSQEYTDDSEETSSEEISDEIHSSSEKSKDINNNDKLFERFNLRPYSPPDYFEDVKYAELGPRINKPAFYHPSFEVPEYERLRLGRVIKDFDSDQSEEYGDSDKSIFPWESYENASKETEEDNEN